MFMPPSPLVIRPSAPDDAPAVAAIYRWHVRNGTGTFELDAPDDAEMTRRRDDVVGKGLPWLVAERTGSVLGYAYANHFRPRLAYREARGARQMLAVIGDSANAASIRVHRALGFADAGLMKSAGWKFGRWLDVVLMQRSLGAGDAIAPAEAA
jgi:L-amino acid N-acyltransferase YncA